MKLQGMHDAGPAIFGLILIVTCAVARLRSCTDVILACSPREPGQRYVILRYVMPSYSVLSVQFFWFGYDIFLLFRSSNLFHFHFVCCRKKYFFEIFFHHIRTSTIFSLFSFQYRLSSSPYRSPLLF
ncbi:unnamed protein product [Cyclocybe aegerita]|uniref:Uncharacterized protein n=1 Tax=Cyclocybe aegerita TaxID=1973307 RepID=A0A8S0WL40_CYCAE|nr:unnamed protein product [Cyclocybe aegerita]